MCLRQNQVNSRQNQVLVVGLEDLLSGELIHKRYRSIGHRNGMDGMNGSQKGLSMSQYKTFLDAFSWGWQGLVMFGPWCIEVGRKHEEIRRVYIFFILEDVGNLGRLRFQSKPKKKKHWSHQNLGN